MKSPKTEIRFNVRGKVQGVFFRKSFVSILTRRNLNGGATNDRKDRHLVHCTVAGTDSEVQNFLKDFKNVTTFNSYGAYIEFIEERDHGISWLDHDANTSKGIEKGFSLGLKIYFD